MQRFARLMPEKHHIAYQPAFACMKDDVASGRYRPFGAEKGPFIVKGPFRFYWSALLKRGQSEDSGS